MCLVWLEAFEKTALSAASHKDHDGEVEHDDDCAHEGYHGYDDHDADGHDSECRFIHISECRFSSTLANVATSKLANVATCCTYAFICIVRTSHFGFKFIFLKLPEFCSNGAFQG